MDLAAPSLSDVGNHAADYVHRDKFVEPGEPIRLTNAVLKWYDLARPETPAASASRCCIAAAAISISC